MADQKQTLLKKFESKQAVGGVVGLGYVGLPLAVEMARSGYATIGLDVSERVVAGINAGTSHIQDIPSDQLAPHVKSGKVRATTKQAELAGCDAISICVPTPLG